MDQEDENYNYSDDQWFNFQDDIENIIKQDNALEFQKIFLKEYQDKAKRLFELGMYEKAILRYDKAIELNPNDQWLYEYKGKLLDKLKRHDEAILTYDKAILMIDKALESNPKNEWIYNQKAQILNRLKRYDQVILMCDKAIKKLRISFSIIPSLLKEKGDALHGLKRYEEAIKMYDIALSFDPHISEAHFNKGYSLINLNRYDEADISFTKPIEMQRFK